MADNRDRNAGATTGFENPSDDAIRQILTCPTTVAVVGCSDNLARDSLRIAILLKRRGFRVIPVNPSLSRDALVEVLGEQVYPDLRSVPTPVEIVDVFRRPEHLPAIAAEAAAIGARILWGQLGVVNDEAARIARAAGMTVVMDRCPAIELRRLSIF